MVFVVTVVLLATLMLIASFILKSSRSRLRNWRDQPKIRRLGNMEMLFCKRHSDGDSILSNAFYIVSKEPLLYSFLKHAFQEVASHAPLLRMSIRTGDGPGKKYFVPVEAPKYEITESNFKSWEETVEREMSVAFNEKEGPLWRVTFLPNCQMRCVVEHEEYQYGGVVIVTCHPAIMDDVSMMRMIGHVLAILNRKKGSESVVNDASFLRPSCDAFTSPVDMMELVRSVPFHLYRIVIALLPKSLLEQKVKKELRNEFILRKGAEIWRNPDVEKKNKIIANYISGVSCSLIEACRKHRVRPQAAVAAAANLALGRIMSDKQDTSDVLISNAVMADARRYSLHIVPVNYIGNFLYVIRKKVHVTHDMASGPVWSSDFWNIASDFHKWTKNKLSRASFIEASREARLANVLITKTTTPSYITNTFAGRVSCLLLFSNDGQCDFVSHPDDCTKVVEWHGASGGIQNGVIFSNHISVLDGALCWTVRYNTHITSSGVAEKFCRMTQDILRDASMQAGMN